MITSCWSGCRAAVSGERRWNSHRSAAHLDTQRRHDAPQVEAKLSLRVDGQEMFLVSCALVCRLLNGFTSLVLQCGCALSASSAGIGLTGSHPAQSAAHFASLLRFQLDRVKFLWPFFHIFRRVGEVLDGEIVRMADASGID